MAQKTKWYSAGRASLLSGAGQILGEDRPQPIVRARVLRGDYTLDAQTVQIGGDLSELRKVSSSTLKPICAETADEVRIEYDPASYGLSRIETVEEREERFKAELDDLNSQLAASREEIETARKRGQEDGFKEGLEQGKEEALDELQAQFDQKMEQVNSLLTILVAATRDYYGRVEKKLVNFALMIAEKVVGSAAQTQAGIATRLAKEALKQAHDRAELVILCHPEDEAELSAAGADLRTVSEGIREIEVRSSELVSRGSIILETHGGSVDATIKTILDEIQIALLDDDSPAKESEE